MKKNSVLVKQVLMSTLTAGMFAFSFSSCSDETDLQPAPADDTEIAAQDGQGLKEPIGLVYSDFINENDVMILDADTTQLSISKALADKKGITDFVQRPMGIWQGFEQRAYLRRATAQELVGDRYILTVVRSGIGEVLGDKDVELNTGIFVNPNASQTRGAGLSDKYTDSQNRIHPSSCMKKKGRT